MSDADDRAWFEGELLKLCNAYRRRILARAASKLREGAGLPERTNIPRSTVEKSSSAAAGMREMLASSQSEPGGKYSETIQPVAPTIDVAKPEPAAAPVGPRKRRRRFIDMTGKVYGSWTVLGEAPSVNGNARWRARHSCGAVHVFDGIHLRHHTPKTCAACRGGRGVRKVASVPVLAPGRPSHDRPEAFVEPESSLDEADQDDLLEQSLRLAEDDKPGRKGWYHATTKTLRKKRDPLDSEPPEAPDEVEDDEDDDEADELDFDEEATG